MEEETMEEIVQLKAKVPQTLKRQAFSVMALRGLKFSSWVREQLAHLVADQQAADRQAARNPVGEAQSHELTAV
jgi:hypothetical protein